MIGYFTLYPDGEMLLGRQHRLARWWAAMSERSTFKETMPDLPQV
jgi:hypothetical protein